MTAATTTHSVQHLEEDMVLNSTLPVKALIYGASVAGTDPTDFVQTAHTSAIAASTFTVSGVAAGDIVLGVGVVSGLAANSYVSQAYVSGTDEVTVIVTGEANTAVTTTAPVCNFIVADVT